MSSRCTPDFLASSQIPFSKHAFYRRLYRTGLFFVHTHLLPLTPVSVGAEKGAPQILHSKDLGLGGGHLSFKQTWPLYHHGLIYYMTKVSLWRIPWPFFTWCSLILPSVPVLGILFSVWSWTGFLVICSKLLSSAGPWALSKMFENERAGKNYKHSSIPGVSPRARLRLYLMSFLFKRSSGLMLVWFQLVSPSVKETCFDRPQMLQHPLSLFKNQIEKNKM